MATSNFNYKYTWIDIYETFGWDERRLIEISVVQRIMGSISILGSAYVIQKVFRSPQKRNHTFHRLMVGLSTADTLYSLFAHVLSTSPMPNGSQVLAIGSLATCDIAGFFTFMCSFVTALYNCSLATYYLVQLKYNWNNRRIKSLEKWLHIVPWSVGLLFAIPGMAFKAYGPFGFICMVTAQYPLNCSLPDSSEKCVRGTDAHFYISLAMFGNLIFAICYVSITMYLTYKSVADIETKARRYSFANYSRSQTATERKRSRRVLVQGILYSLALFLINILSIITIILAKLGIRSYVLHILAYTFWPLQGFFNALIYSIPVFQRIYTRYRERRNKNEKNERGSSNINRSSMDNKDQELQFPLEELDGIIVIDRSDEERKRNKNDGEEEKEEIQKSNKPTFFCPGILCGRDNSDELNMECCGDIDKDGSDSDVDDYILFSLR